MDSYFYNDFLWQDLQDLTGSFYRSPEESGKFQSPPAKKEIHKILLILSNFVFNKNKNPFRLKKIK